MKWDRRDEDYPLVGVYGPEDDPETWQANGQAIHDPVSPRDLVMTPLGYIDGKPVFVGYKVVTPTGMEWIATPKCRGGHGSLGDCTWPAPPRQYPKSKMDWAHLAKVALQADGCPISIADVQILAIANAALRHAIDAGQVVMAEEHDAALKAHDVLLENARADVALANEQVRSAGQAMADRRAARDMEIAKAVRGECDLKWRHIGDNPSIDLAAIIAKVQA